MTQDNQSKTKISEILRFIAVSFGFGIQNVVWSCIPIIFYRPTTVCEYSENFHNTLFKCSEINACKYQQYLGQIEFSRVSQYDHIQSIPMEFNLYCEDKIYEANILAIGILGQPVGAFLALILNIPAHQQQKSLILLLFVQFFIFLGCNIVDNLTTFTILFFGWNFIANFYQCVVYSHVNSSFTTGILKQYGPTLLNIIWAGTTVIYILVTLVLGDWRQSLGLFLCSLTAACLVILIFTYNKKYDIKQKEAFERKIQQQQDLQKYNIENGQINFVQNEEQEQQNEQLFSNFNYALKKIRGNKLWQLNCWIFILNMMAGTIAYYLVAIVLNTMVGDLYVNNLGCAILEISAQLLSGYIIYKKCDLKTSIKNIFYIIGIAFIACIIVQDSSDRSNYKNMGYFTIFIKLLPVIIGKGTHEMLWTILYTYITDIIPEDLHTFTTANSQIITILICSLMPYYKFLMEYLNFNTFFGLGICCILVAKYSNNYQEDPNLKDGIRVRKIRSRVNSFSSINFNKQRTFSASQNDSINMELIQTV